MNILFVHKNYPAQFGQVAKLLEAQGHKTRFLTAKKHEKPLTELLNYEPMVAGGETPGVISGQFLNTMSHALGTYKAAKGLEPKPDIIVAHSGFGSTLFLKELFDCPVVSLFEFFYRPDITATEYRMDQRVEEEYMRRLYFMNTMILLDLQYSDAGYTPTQFQRNQFPVEYLPKIQTLFDGIDRRVFRRTEPARTFRGRTIPDSTKIITYVSRGFESMRGFDVFIRTAKRIYEQHPDVLFITVGSDRVCYGGDLRFIEEKSYREHVMKKEAPDESKFFFTGMIGTSDLVQLLNLSDVHLYFTVPFVLSWSLFNALSCGCRVVSSRTPPVEEVIVHGWNGLLADFMDHEQHAENALKILRNPAEHAFMGDNAIQTIEDKYAMKRTFPQFIRLLEKVVEN